MKNVSKALRDNFKFGGNFSYFSLCLTDNLTMTNFLHYHQLLSELNKCLTLNMFSEVPRVQIKKVMIFAYDLIWIFMAWLCFYMLMLFDELMFVHLHLSWGYENVEVSGQSIVAFIFLTFSFKCSWHILRYSEAIIRKCSVKRVFLNISQNS